MMTRRDWAETLGGLILLGIWVGLLTAFVVYVLVETQ